MNDAPPAPTSSPAHRTLAGALALTGVVIGAALTWHGLASMQQPPRGYRQFGLVLGVAAALFVLGHACRRWLRLGVTTWIAVVAAGALALAGQLWAVMAVTMTAGAAAGIGRLVVPGPAGLRDRILVGTVVLGTAVGLLAHVPIHYEGTYAVGMLGCLLLTRRTLAEDLRGLRTTAARPPVGPAIAAVQALIGAVLIAHLLMVMMPERGYDALVTHLLLPARIADQHVWDFDFRSFVWTLMPLLGDWVYTVTYMLAGEQAARLTNFANMLMLAWLAHDLARWAGAGRLGALAGALVLLSTPLAYVETSMLFYDAAWAAWTTAGLFLLLRLGDPEPSDAGRRLLVAGILLGGGLAAKAVTLTILPMAAAIVLWHGRRLVRAWRWTAGAFSIGAAIGCIPYLRAWILAGNPVFPFFNAVFRSPHYPPEDFAPPAQFDRGLQWDTLYAITFESRRFLESADGAAGFHWLLVVVPAIPVLLLARRWRALVLLVAAAVAVWVTFRQTAYLRYVLPSFVLAAGTVGVALCPRALGSRIAALSLALGAAVAVVLGLHALSAGSFHKGVYFRALFDDRARADYVTLHVPLRRCVEVVNAVNPRGNPVPFFSAPLAAGLQARPLFTNWYNPSFVAAMRECGSAAELGELLASHHVQHVLLSDEWPEPMRSHVQQITSSVHRVGDHAVLRLDERHRHRHEICPDPDLTDADRWQIGGAVQFTPGSCLIEHGAILRTDVAIAGSRSHRLSTSMLSATTDATASIEITWRSERGRALQRSEYTLTADEPTIDIEILAPARARRASLAVRAIGGRVSLTRLSLRD